MSAERPIDALLKRLLPGNASALSFMLRFVGIAAVLSAFYAYPYADGGSVDRALSRYLDGYASTAGAVLSVFDPVVHVRGAEITGRFALRIVKDCDAMDVNILLAAAILAFPASVRRRALGLSCGLLVVFVANVARICLLYFIGASAPTAFELAHRDLFPLGLVLLVAGMFVLWARGAGPSLGIGRENGLA